MILGIDVGISGAIAVLTSDGKLVNVFDIPVLHDGPAGRRSINAVLLAFHLREIGKEITIAYVESVGPRPGEGAVGAFAFGRSRGVIEGVLAAYGVPVQFIAPAKWKRVIGIPPGKIEAKDLARSEIIRRFPEHANFFQLKKHSDRAEACLVAIAGVMLNERIP